MQHIFEYKKAGEKWKLTASMIVEGEDESHTAMAKTVGLPLGITALLLLKNEIKMSGLILPGPQRIVRKSAPGFGRKRHSVYRENRENLGPVFLEKNTNLVSKIRDVHTYQCESGIKNNNTLIISILRLCKNYCE